PSALCIDAKPLDADGSGVRTDELRIMLFIALQLPIEHWHGWIGDETIADAMLDRLMQRHHRITLTGESLRKSSPKPSVLEPELDQS
ncbi:ATP-binding protein, partial [Paraburkholderia sp. RL17-373-BIF-A]|uniref:ATP-binding protein n=1 Tax=Paraburkholderia sp. RL17-373-BIF-A TaxID=3031629 RepID=UPI0038B99A4C